MNTAELRTLLLSYFTEYFGDNRVIFEESSSGAVKPKTTADAPVFVSLKLSEAESSVFSSDVIMNPPQSGDLVIRYVPSSCILSVNLYSIGMSVEEREGYETVRDNDAVERLMRFCNYLKTDHMMEHMENNDIFLFPMTKISDVSQLLNGSRYQYRAHIQYRVSYMQAVKASDFGRTDDYFIEAIIEDESEET